MYHGSSLGADEHEYGSKSNEQNQGGKSSEKHSYFDGIQISVIYLEYDISIQWTSNEKWKSLTTW